MPLLARTPLITLLTCCFFVGFASCVRAQSCDYQLILEDLVRADGWNGGELTVTVAGVPRTYTLTEDDDSTRSVFFPVMTGDLVELGFSRGAFPEETSFRILDNNDSLIYAVTMPADDPDLDSFTATCVSCAPPAANSVVFSRVRFNFVVLRFNQSGTGMSDYVITYGPEGFDPDDQTSGITVTTQDTFLRVNGLESDSTYSFYVSTICPAEMDTSARRGPFTVLLPREKDVAATQLRSPVTDCEIGNSPVTIGITNFGGAPQAFFGVNFSINGGAPIASQPTDGLFTGVVGVDSTEEFTFDATADLTEAGVYTFRVWTELEDDQDRSNDTLTTVVTSILRVTEFPYTEDFEEDNGFWRPLRDGRGPSSWEYGRVTGAILNDAGTGTRAWATNLDGEYNNNELSYLRSPCFDFSGFEDDPVFSTLLYVDTEENFDALWLESSVDKGDSWQRVESSPSSVNWYNDLENQAWEGDGGFGNGYVAASNLLDGLAGEEEVRLRFVFRSSRSDTRLGVVVDDIAIQERAEVDLAVNRVRLGTEEACRNLPLDTLLVTVSNLGMETIDSIELSYTTENGTGEFLQTFVGLDLTTRETMTIIFPIPALALPTRIQSEQLFVSATVLGQEETGTLDNNQASLLGFRYFDLPFIEDFNDGEVPEFWTLDDDLIVTDAIVDNLAATDTLLRFTTANYGVLEEGDILAFDIRLTDFVPDTSLTVVAGDLIVNAIFDCRDTVNLVTEIGDIDTDTYTFSLDRPGATVTFEIIARRDTGDFLIEFDNFNVGMECPDDLGIVIDVVPATRPNRRNGTATLVPTRGLAPFTYNWSNGAMTASVDSIVPGIYTVTVTDSRGCTDIVEVPVDFNTSLDEQGLLAGLKVYPNPTRGDLRLSLELNENVPVVATLTTVDGRPVQRVDYGNRLLLQETFPTRNLSAGLYFLTLSAGGVQRTVRVVVNP